jgi:hypothetical protein
MFSPSNLDLARHVKPQWIEHAESLIDRVVRGGIENGSWEKYVRVNFAVLRNSIPDKIIKPLKAELLNAGILETDGQWIAGEKSLAYRFGPEYRHQEISTPEPKVRRLRDPVHRWLRDNFAELGIDLELADSLLADHPARELVSIPAKQIAERTPEFTYCRYGRVHTSLTRMPKVLRAALVSGGDLWEVDIANSQPLLLAIIAANVDGFRDVRFRKKMSPYILPSLHPSGPFPTPPSIMNSNSSTVLAYHTIGHALATTEILPKVQEFIDVCERGDFYRVVGQGRPKDEVKEQLFGVLYGKNRSSSPLKTRFRQLFPPIAALVHDLKQEDHAYLPRLMQLIESTLIIDRVCRRLMAKHVPVWTIHDSLLTVENNIEHVQSVLLDEFAAIGLTPTLHRKCLRPIQLFSDF